MFCTHCGKPITEGMIFCPHCGHRVDGAAQQQNQNQQNPQSQQQGTYQPYSANGAAKSRVVCGLLAIFLGWLGVHNFYLGYQSKATAQLLVGTVGILACGLGPVVSGIWGLVEGIQIFSGTINVDAFGVPLRD